mgnify:CR=1 FL=1
MGAFICAFFVAALIAPWLFKLLGRNAFGLLALVPAGAFVYSVLSVPGQTPRTQDVHWLPALGMSLVLRMDALSWLMSLLVTGVGALVFVYCMRYFERGDPTLGNFAAKFTAFAGMMYGLVLADELLTMFIFWEGTTVFSYLLVGHNAARRAARRAALQALLITTAGGLAMLIGMIILQTVAGTGRISTIVSLGYPGLTVHGPPGVIITAIVLILIGAVSKSALLPFHFWLPGAMAAPTPVSAYLHAAAMVKAGIYLVLRLASGFAETPGWLPLLLILGVTTVLVGGYQALKQFDLKSILAYGTVSQLGILTVISAFGTPDTTKAALAMLLSHSLFKCVLFLATGIIDHHAGTRDIRKLSGFGRACPTLTVATVIAAASMAGIPLLYGFIAKEALYSTLLSTGTKESIMALIGLVAGSVLTLAYAWRFVTGAFAVKPGVARIAPAHPGALLLTAPLILAAAIVVLGLNPAPFEALFATVVHSDYHLALWHGIEPALGLSALTIALGVALCVFSKQVAVFQSAAAGEWNFTRGYRRTIELLEDFAAFVTARTQRGSLPFYQAVIYLVALGALGVTLLANDTWPESIRVADSWQQVLLAAVMIPAAIAACVAQKRFAAVVIVGITGYGMVAFFAFQGAPDLALTQVLVESITLVVFVLVLRRLPRRIGSPGSRATPAIRLLIGAAFGVLAMVLTAVAMGARSATPISQKWGELAYEGGHGKNIVNVALVDMRAWDTMGELSVVVVAAIGISSLIFVRSREGTLERMSTRRPHGVARIATVAEPTPSQDVRRNAWLLAGRTLAPGNRSIILEVVVRLIFHLMLVFSVYLLFAGHNLPGGGFAAGLVAGLALIARYLAGGRFELAEAVRIDAGILMGAGMLTTGLTALGGMLWGDAILESAYWQADVPILGHLSFGTSTIFDIGVYLVVIGLMIDILRAIGVEVDVHQEQDEARLAESLATTGMGAGARRRIPALLGRIDDFDVDDTEKGGSL